MEDLFTSLAPTYILSKIVGTVPYKPVGIKGERTFDISNITSFYGTIIVLCHVVLSIWLYIDYCYNSIVQLNISQMMFLLQSVADVTLIITILYSNYNYRHYQVTLGKKLALLDKDLKQIGVFSNYRTMSKYSSLRILVEIILAIIYVQLIFFTINSRTKIQLYIYVLNYILDILIKFSVFLQLENWILMLCERFDTIHDHFINSHKDMSLSAKIDRSSFICAIGKTASIHKKLCAYVKEINDMYSFQLLVTVALAFALLLTHAFNICRYIITTNLDDQESLLYSIYSVVYNSIKMLIICSLCSRLGYKVGEK